MLLSCQLRYDSLHVFRGKTMGLPTDTRGPSTSPQPLLPAIHEVKITGHLDLPQLRAVLQPIVDAQAHRPGKFRMVLDARQMETYDPAARDWWVREWSPIYRPHLERVAMVTDRTVWHMLA